MTYEAWRISYQSDEQAARAAFAEVERLRRGRIADFVAGVRWWEFSRTGATLWGEDRQLAEAAAVARLAAEQAPPDSDHDQPAHCQAI
jgi:hypothetical protein